MDKLTLEHLAPYLPYNLKAEMLDYKSDYVGKQYDEIIGVHQWDKHYLYWSALTIGGSKPNIESIKPLFRLLSDYTDINSPSMSDLNTDLDIQMEICDLSNKKIHYRSLSYGTALTCFKAHIDVFRLIDKGLAIDINTVEK